MQRNNAEETLKDRLIDAGAQFKGSFPSAREVLRDCFEHPTRVIFQLRCGVDTTILLLYTNPVFEIFGLMIFDAGLYSAYGADDLGDNSQYSCMAAKYFSLDQIAQARRKTEAAKDMDGMDSTNVIPGSRRRGRPADDIVSPPNKKQRSDVDTQEGGSDSECSEDGSTGSAYEESEEEFQLSG